MKQSDRSDRPLAAMLGDPASLFPRELARHWRARGLNVIHVARPDQPHTIEDLDTIDSGSFRSGIYRTFDELLLRPLFRRVERFIIPMFRRSFRRRLGLIDDDERWYPIFAADLMLAWPLSLAARSVGPSFVFGHEVTTHGLATALCAGVPRILFPWGADVFAYAESSPMHRLIARVALNGVDLVIPSSTSAAKHICQRFGVPPERVVPISWGVAREDFADLAPDRVARVRRALGVPLESVVILNSRRFRPVWGCFVALEAFLEIASESSETHFILLGGEATSEFLDEAERRIAERGHTRRFTILRDQIPLSEVRDAMIAADMFVSLLGRGDMRSSSVLEATAAGGVPIVADGDEYRTMERLGFRALFVDGDSVIEVAAGLRNAIGDADLCREIRGANDQYIRSHEDRAVQMDRMLEEIDGVCRTYGRSLEFERLGAHDD